MQPQRLDRKAASAPGEVPLRHALLPGSGLESRGAVAASEGRSQGPLAAYDPWYGCGSYTELGITQASGLWLFAFYGTASSNLSFFEPSE